MAIGAAGISIGERARAWKRNPGTGARTHHIHMVENGPEFAEHWDRLFFRDCPIEHPDVAKEYQGLKIGLASASPRDRAACTRGKTDFTLRVTSQGWASRIRRSAA